jgi:F420-dependent oxidoreductase-like protein
MDLRIFTEPQQGASYDQLLRMARKTEECGFDAFFRSDHYLKMGRATGLPGPTDSWVTLGALAVQTSRIRLGTLMSSATFRYPGPLAISVAQVDQMSGGRVELGIGAGWYADEHAAYGIPFPDVRERFDRFSEQLAVITGLWETPEGGTFSYDGKYYPVADSPALPKPAQRPRPPVIIGGGGKRRTPALSARYADEYNAAFTTPERAGELYARVAGACREIDRDPATLRLSIAQELCCGRTEAEVRRRSEHFGRDLAGLREFGLTGTPAELVDKLGRLGEAGATRVYLQVMDLDDLDHLDLVASEVARQL